MPTKKPQYFQLKFMKIIAYIMCVGSVPISVTWHCIATVVRTTKCMTKWHGQVGSSLLSIWQVPASYVGPGTGSLRTHGHTSG